MAFDQTTRNRLQRFVNDARRVLEEEFTRQLQNDYGMDPNSGAVAELAGLRHINDAQRETARILRETLAHYTASGDMDSKLGLDRIVREQAFTVLNRLAALRMAEARGLLIESVGNGYQAKGFQLYARLVGTGLGETGDAYRTYLQSVFDEFALDLPGLFDRYSPQGRLFPREAALLQVLALINHGEIEPLWAEDETIGWIYQYFNSKEERKAMREASQAPRNSRELAVRNQFFTPRYVVEFLVDNTLGRLWFNWTGGQTALRDRCQYLLVKPDEQPEPAARLRDPRTIKLLDPACGSMHFGLYAFDLFQEIYHGAWDWEQAHGPNALDRATGGSPDLTPLSDTYADQDAFLRDVPRLIIEHNIYGVDIDPRAAQIASLALWLRAQRAWHEAGVKAKDRPQVGQGHVVAAVAPPAEVDLRKRFMEELDPLDAELFEQTLFMLKGLPELGVLLQVEKELPALIRKVFGEHGPMFSKEDMAQWQKAETRLREALTDYGRAARFTYQGRLFAEDALQGLRVIDLCREQFDVVVMNPPFGAPTEAKYNEIRERYFGSHNDIYAAFVARASELAPSGMVGCISSRSFMLSPRLQPFREEIIIERLEVLADLGWGVMDDALVEAAAYTLSAEAKTDFVALDVRKSSVTRDLALSSSLSSGMLMICEKSWFNAIPQSKLLYSAPSEVRDLLASPRQFEPDAGTAREGMKSFDNFRFIRLLWEISPQKIGVGKKWVDFNKGGEFSFFVSDFHLLINWSNDGAELKEININLNGSTAQVRQASDYWYRAGATYSKRSSRGFSARALPKGMIFTSNGPAILPNRDVSFGYILGWVNSKQIRSLTHLQSNASDYSTGSLKRLPWRQPKPTQAEAIESYVGDAISAVVSYRSRVNETARSFLSPAVDGSLSASLEKLTQLAEGATAEVASNLRLIDKIIEEVYSLPNSEWADELLGAGNDDDVEDHSAEKEEHSDDDITLSEGAVGDLILSWAAGVAFGRFDWRLATGEREVPPEPNPFDPLPAKSPGMLPNGAAPFHAHSGILVDDQGHPHDLPRLIEEVLARVQADVPGEVRRWLQRDFFPLHLTQYSKSRRKAPIYWPLSTTSGSYTLWLYYPSLTSQTLYSAVNDFVEPKLKQVSRDTATLRDKGAARSRDDERAFEALQALELELVELRDTLLQIAPTYRPNHDDGVQITAAPLWQLFRHKPWQKILKDTWAKLKKGDYDWAHLAMNYWPERVREKCKTDKSLAIAHGLEDLYVEPQAAPKKTRGRKTTGATE